jgi:hypothetical protein
MKNAIIPAAIGAVLLSGCVIDAGEHGFDDFDLEDRTRMAIEACGAGNVKEVSSSGFQCKTFGEGGMRN